MAADVQRLQHHHHHHRQLLVQAQDEASRVTAGSVAEQDTAPQIVIKSTAAKWGGQLNEGMCESQGDFR